MTLFIDQLRQIVGDLGFVDDPVVQHGMLVDERQLYKGSALAIVKPSSTAMLAEVMRLCHANQIGMVPQGGNTGYCGGATPDESGRQVLINLARLNRVRDIDCANRTMCVEAGTTLAVAQDAAAAQGLLLPLSMGSEGTCQVGGNVSTNAGGLAVLHYGTTRDLIAGIEAVLPDGRVYSALKGLRKDNTGYDLKQLFIGAEGTLGIISAVVFRLSPKPRDYITMWLNVDGIDNAVELLNTMRAEIGDRVTSFEFISRESYGLVDEYCGDFVLPPDPGDGHFALIELHAFDDVDELRDNLANLIAQIIESGQANDAVIAQSETQRRSFWRLRESIPAAEKRAGGAVKHDVSVRLSRLGEFSAAAASLVANNIGPCRLSIYGHVGDGNIHFNVLAPVSADSMEFRATFADVISATTHTLAQEFSGSFSAEHGVGKLKRDLLSETTDDVSMDLMRLVKSALDPSGLMNPGKVL